MFEQSLTYAVLLRIKSFFGKYKTSVTFGLILALVSLFKKLCLAFETSQTKRIIFAFASYIQKSFKNSFTRKYILGTSKFQEKYHSSYFYNLTSRAVSRFLSFSEGKAPCVRDYFESGITGAAYKKLHSLKFMRFEYMLGAFFAIMMVFPGKVWNNIYAVGAAFIFAVLYYASHISGRRFAFDVRSVPVSLFTFFVAILGGIMISPVFSDGLRIALFFISSIIFSLIIWGSMTETDRLKSFVKMAVVSLTVMCVYAIYQAIVGVPVDYLLTDIYTNAGMPGRAYSTFDNPNNFAEVIVLVVPFLYALIICAKEKKQKTIYVIMFLICLIALGTTYSRSCYVAFAIATVVFALMYDWRLLIPLVVIVIVAIPFLPESVFNRILTIGSMDDTSNSYRIYLWEGVLKVVRERGLTGIGIGPEAFTAAYKPLANSLASLAPHSHMLYLELLVELGILGVLGFLTFFFGVLKKGFASVGCANKEVKCMIIAALSALLGISFTSCAEYVWFYPRVMFVYWMVVGVLLAAVRCTGKTNNDIKE